MVLTQHALHKSAFITNKRVVIPKSISINNKTINVVDKFRLLGVLVDDKFKFDTCVTQQCLAINRRLFTVQKVILLTTSN